MDSSARSGAAVVTGAASGIGKAVAVELSSRVEAVVIADVDGERGESVASELRARGARAAFVETDVRSASDVARAVARAEELAGPIEWMVNDAGFGVLGEVRDMTLDHWRRLVDVNLMGVVHGVAAAYPSMVERRRGRILNVASLAGLLPAPTGVGYATTKHAVVGLSLSLRAEAAAHGVSVTVGCPGFVRTGFGDAATYLRVRREAVFRPAPPDPAAVRRVGALLVEGAARGRAVVTTSPLARLAWWSARLAPWVWTGVVGRRVMARHVSVRTRDP